MRTEAARIARAADERRCVVAAGTGPAGMGALRCVGRGREQGCAAGARMRARTKPRSHSQGRI